MTWAMLKLASLSCFHINAHSLNVRVTYMLTIVKFLLFESLKVMNCALLSKKMSVVKENVVVPEGGSFPLVEVRQSASPRWCSYKSKIWGGMAREVTHALISFCFGEFFPRFFTFKDAMVMAFLFMSRLF